MMNEVKRTVGKMVFRFSKPVEINGVLTDSVEWRALTVGDLRAVNKLQGGNQVVGMIAKACGVSPDDVRNFKTRDFATLRQLVVGDVDELDEGRGAECFEVNDEEEIVVSLNDVLTVSSPDGGVKEIDSVTVQELTTAETLRAEKLAKGNDFEMVYHRVRASVDLKSEVLDLMSKRDFSRVAQAVSVFFTPSEDGGNT